MLPFQQRTADLLRSQAPIPATTENIRDISITVAFSAGFKFEPTTLPEGYAITGAKPGGSATRVYDGAGADWLTSITNWDKLAIRLYRSRSIPHYAESLEHMYPFLLDRLPLHMIHLVQLSTKQAVIARLFHGGEAGVHGMAIAPVKHPALALAAAYLNLPNIGA